MVPLANIFFSESTSEDEHSRGVIATVAEIPKGIATGAAAVVGMSAGAVVGTVQFGVNTVSSAAHAVTDGVTHAVESVAEKAKDLTLGAAELVGEGAGLAANTVSAVAAAPGAMVGGVVHAAENVKDTAANLVGLGKTESAEEEPKEEKTEEEPKSEKEEDSETEEKATSEIEKPAEKKEFSKTENKPIIRDSEFDTTDTTQPANLDPCLMPTLMPELRNSEHARQPETVVEEVKKVEPVKADPNVDGVHPVADLPKTFADAVKEGEKHHETPGHEGKHLFS